MFFQTENSYSTTVTENSYSTTSGQSSPVVITSVNNIQSEDQIQSRTQPFSPIKEIKFKENPRKSEQNIRHIMKSLSLPYMQS